MTDFNEMAKIAKRKMLLKEYKQENNYSNEPSIIYLEDGDEFQIQLFNPTNRIVGASIQFNGDNSYYSSSYLVLRPGERIWLERYLDSPRKFQFNTYTVSNNKSAKEAIKDNGDIIVKFYYEQKRVEHFTYAPTILYSTDNWTCTGNTTAATGCIDNTYQVNNINNVNSADNTLGLSTATALNGVYDITASACTSASTITNATSTYTSTYCGNPIKTGTRSLSKKTANKTIETGRIEEGDRSNQKFKHVYYDFESWAFYTKSFKILPLSRKQYNKDDLTKVYCTNCGKKLSPKFKFCPVCGTKVNN